VLFLASDLFKQDALSLDREIRKITAEIGAADHRALLEPVQVLAVEADDLQKLLLLDKPRIVHFSGHGTRQAADPAPAPERGGVVTRDLVVKGPVAHGQIILMGDMGRPEPLSKAAVVNLIHVLSWGGNGPP
jgi:hypothetical protein